MAKKNSDIKPHEMAFINEREAIITSIIGAIEEVSKFKKGDFLIAFRPASTWQTRHQITNSYGAPKKYVVIYTDKYGVPYMKEINKAGNPAGQIISPIKFDNSNRVVVLIDHEFEVDPDYADALIMADEENFDVVESHKMKSDLFKEIAKYNKSLKVNCHDMKELIQFLQNLKVGDVVYKSIKAHFTILSLDPIPVTHNRTFVNMDKNFGKAQDSKGKIFDLNYGTFKWRAIYAGQPRSYNELKDPK